ncbi:MAG: hypothetical protein A2104_06995 [Candidatus Melainabacteria bacterium GWF2_32_7]|nr:MAG: hypothetical protein A2104_06995 [Candidatus Melainabacteria bacterium GWF2_32_7]
MKDSEIIDTLDKLTLEADMLTEILDDALKLKYYDAEYDVCAISFLSGKIRKKFKKIRALF